MNTILDTLTQDDLAEQVPAVRELVATATRTATSEGGNGGWNNWSNWNNSAPAPRP